MALSDDEDPVGALPTDGANPALGEGVRLWTRVIGDEVSGTLMTIRPWTNIWPIPLEKSSLHVRLRIGLVDESTEDMGA